MPLSLISLIDKDKLFTTSGSVCLLQAIENSRGFLVNLKKLKNFKHAFEKAWELSKNSDYWNAAILNGIATTAILNAEPNLIMKLMEKGAKCATISGNGPSIIAISDKKNKEL